MTNNDQNQNQSQSSNGKTSWKPTPGWIVGAAFVMAALLFGSAVWEAIGTYKAEHAADSLTITTAPAKSAESDTAEVTAKTADSESEFVRTLWRDVPQFKTLTKQQTISAGQTACVLKDQGWTDRKVLNKAHNLLGIDMEDATTFVGYSFNVFCPEYSR